jgi:glycosyltransferase involved in cell wall biosynthesis
MKIVVVGGVCVQSDAISAALLSQATILAGLPGVDHVSVATQACDRSTALDVNIVADSWSLVRLPSVVDADLVIFHWGIAYELFDALPLVAATTRTVVHFHNVTPRHLVAESQRPTIDRSLAQIQLLGMSDSVIWTESEFNAETLVEWGIDRDRIIFMPFPVEAPGRIRRTQRSGAIKLLTIGRLVHAKGVEVLIDAFGYAVQQSSIPMELTLMGNSTLSDVDFLVRLQRRIDEFGLSEIVRVVTDADDAAIWKALERSDIVVSPSLHEGLCVPVIEAYIAGCRVIGTDAGNLPFIVQDPDPIAPAGDAAALGTAIVGLATELSTGVVEWPAGADRLVECFSTRSVTHRLRAAIALQDADLPSYASTSWIDSGMSRRNAVDA